MAFLSRVFATSLAVSFVLAAGSVAAQTRDAGSPVPDPALGIVAETGADGVLVTLWGLDPETRARLGAGAFDVHIRPVGQADGGMTATLHDGEGGALQLRPRFPLLPGVPYEAVLSSGGATATILPIATPEIDLPPARVEGIFPAADVLPANTLRLYLHFDAPMARGRGRDRIHLETAAGERLEDSFLNLRAELWSEDQTRRTLLLDPGRIKRGVGSNLEGGAPLEAGGAYRIVVDAALPDAMGRPMAEPFVHAFRVGPAERRAIDPTGWAIDRPVPGTRAPLKVRFDRLMDRAIVQRALVVLDAGQLPLAGSATATDQGWRFVPGAPWPTGTLHLRVDPVLEDVAGNTICHPFDTASGTAGPCAAARVLNIATSDAE